jgi:hypothetical protein
MLTGLGAKYKIVLPSGEEYGELEIRPAEQRKEREPWHGYVKDYIKDAKPGTLIVIPLPPGRELNKLSSAVSGSACHLFGRGTPSPSATPETTPLNL